VRSFATKVDDIRPRDDRQPIEPPSSDVVNFGPLRSIHPVSIFFNTPRCGDDVPSGIEQCTVETKGSLSMKKALPEKMFTDDQSRMSMLRAWVLDQGVTEIQMSERQFWNFAALQPISEKPWVTFMGRKLRVPEMPEASQKCLGIDDPQRPGSI
jgi:hypothetical protein